MLLRTRTVQGSGAQSVSSVRRRDWGAAVVAVALLAAAGCGPIAEQQPSTLRAGYDTLDGTLAVWPTRGRLADDPKTRAAVTEAVQAWRSPIDDRVHLATSGILFADEINGQRLALVAADVPGEGASWLLQVAGDGKGYRVSQAVEYTDPGYLVYSDVLPVQLADGRRYFTSARVKQLVGPGGKPLAITDGLTARVDVPTCTAVQLTASLHSTESVPGGRDARLLDFGTGITGPRYPLIADTGGSGLAALDGLDTCALAQQEGPFGSIPRRIRHRESPESAPASWPIDDLSVTGLGEVALGGGAAGTLHQLSWHTAEGTMAAMIYRPAGGTPIYSPADRANDLQAFLLPVPGQPVAVLTWQASPKSALSVPADTPRLVDRPGLVVVPAPKRKETFSLSLADQMHYRSLGED